MLPKSRVIAALEHHKPDRVPVGEIGVDYTITEQALGHETLYRAKWKEYMAFWQGRREEIVEQYKGTIEVKSKVDVGSKFIIRLPVSAAPKAETAETE